MGRSWWIRNPRARNERGPAACAPGLVWPAGSCALLQAQDRRLSSANQRSAHVRIAAHVHFCVSCACADARSACCADNTTLSDTASSLLAVCTKHESHCRPGHHVMQRMHGTDERTAAALMLALRHEATLVANFRSRRLARVLRRSPALRAPPAAHLSIFPSRLGDISSSTQRRCAGCASQCEQLAATIQQPCPVRSGRHPSAFSARTADASAGMHFVVHSGWSKAAWKRSERSEIFNSCSTQSHVASSPSDHA